MRIGNWAPWLVERALDKLPTLSDADHERDLLAVMIDGHTCLEDWLDRTKIDGVADCVRQVILRGGAARSLGGEDGLEDEGVWETLLYLLGGEPGKGLPLFKAVVEAGAQVDPGFATRLLAYLAETFEPHPIAVKTAIALGADTLAMMPGRKEDQEPESILDAAMANGTWTAQLRSIIRGEAEKTIEGGIQRQVLPFRR